MKKRRKKLRAAAERSKYPRRGDKRALHGSLKDLPPNENLNKMPDEAYGDTEIPSRRV